MAAVNKAVYALTSSGCDFYSAMTRVSVASLRLCNPSISVTLVCDDVSGRALKSACDPLLDEVDELLTSEAPEGDASYRNRHIKTRIRHIVEGPFLFLDSDTFIRGDLSPIFLLDTDIAGAANHSQDQFEKQVVSWEIEGLRAMGWAIGQEIYVNGGVLFYNDTSYSYRFSSLWHQKWLYSYERLGTHHDQAALHSAIFETTPRFAILPHVFNAQVKVAPHIARDAVVWHYYASSFGIAITSFEVLVERLLRGEKLCSNSIAEMIHRPHPWRRESWLDDLVAWRMGHNGALDAGYNSWFQGRRIRAVSYWTFHPIDRAIAALRWRLKLRTRVRDILARIVPHH